MRFTVTAALPYANGPIHIGQLAGAYIAPDIFTRFRRLQGHEVAFICGSDEHGVAITLRARNEGKSPRDVVDHYHQLNKESFERFGIDFDIFHRTSDPLHHETAQEFFANLHAKGEFELRESEQFYDAEHDQFLADRYILGECPNCANPDAYGDQCEKCGTSLSPDELKNPRSALSGNTPERRKTRHWYLPLNKYEAWLRSWILEDHADWKKNVYGQCKSWLEQGLHPRAMTRDLDWGVAVPLPEADGKVLYVWLDAPIGYISATKAWANEHGKDWKAFWQDEDTQLLHFIGKDNIVFHCIIFPVILKAHGDFILPTNVPANEFMNMEGDKISTSRNWAVWLHEYLDQFPGKEDVLRYVLTANMPETKDSEFTWKDFQQRNNAELVGVFGNFVNRAMVLCHKYYEGVVPQAPLEDQELAPGTTWSSLKAEADRCLKEIETNIAAFRFRDALQGLMGLAREGNRFIQDAEPWKKAKTDPEGTAHILYASIQIAGLLSLAAQPFLPNTARKLMDMLRISGLDWPEKAGEVLPSGHQLGPSALLFERIEDEVVNLQIQRLHENKAKKMEPKVEEKPEISFEQFAAMDLVVGTVLACEKVPKTDKLLKFDIDLGTERRVIVSGIAEHFDPATLPGRQVMVVANLKPRKIRGVESKGMILMAEDAEGNLRLMQPEKETEPGSRIS